MNFAKRPRDDSLDVRQSQIIDLTSDDEVPPPPKRQKSIPRNLDESQSNQSHDGASMMNKHAQHRARTPETPATQNLSWNTEKKSPFKNTPPWLSTAASISISNHKTKPTSPSVQHDVSLRSASPLVNLTINRKNGAHLERPTTQTCPPDFRLADSTPLKFSISADAQPKSNLTNNHLTITSQSSRLRADPSPVPLARQIGSTKLTPHGNLQINLPVRGSTPISQQQHEHQQRQQHHHRHHQRQHEQQLLPAPAPSSAPQPVIATAPATAAATLGPVPGKLVVNVPLSRHKQLRRELVQRLKKDVAYAKDNEQRINSVLGLTGFSTSTFSLDLDDEKYRNAKPNKKRKVDRSTVQLDFGVQSRTLIPSSGTMVHPREQAKAVLTDRFGEVFRPPLTFSNNLNESRLDGKFQFVNNYIIRPGVKMGASARAGCTRSCPDGHCSLTCSCITQYTKEDEKHQQVPTYEVNLPSRLVVLTDEYIKDHSRHHEIYECSSKCLCAASCTQRVVQKGRTVPLEIFQTARCGFGVRSSQRILRGQFIDSYLGELITEAELSSREEASEENQPSYIYSLDWFSMESHSQPYHIDSKNFGTPTRFVNHSCSPNAKCFTVLNHGSTKNVYSIAFFAIKEIPAGTEITIDYVPQMTRELDADSDMGDDDNDDDKNKDVADAMAAMQLHGDEGVQECFCGAPNCRKRLWRGPKRKGKRT